MRAEALRNFRICSDWKVLINFTRQSWQVRAYAVFTSPDRVHKFNIMYAVLAMHASLALVNINGFVRLVRLKNKAMEQQREHTRSTPTDPQTHRYQHLKHVFRRTKKKKKTNPCSILCQKQFEAHKSGSGSRSIKLVNCSDP